MFSELLDLIATNPVLKWTVVFIFGFYAIYKYYSLKPKCWESQGVRTAKTGHFLTRMKTPWLDWEVKLVKENGKLFGMYQGGDPVLFLSDPELIRNVLVKDFHIFMNRRELRTGGDRIFDNMLSTIRDDHWKRVRSIMSPSFTTGKLKNMLPLINECLDTLRKNLDKCCESTEESDLKTIFGAYSMEVVIQVAFGTKVDALIDESNPILSNAKRIFSKDIGLRVLVIILFPKLAKFLKLSVWDPKITNFFIEFTENIIEMRKRSQNKSKRVDFLQLMMDSMKNNDNSNEEETEDMKENTDKYSEFKSTDRFDKTLTKDELVAQSVLFFLAGYETTSSTISLCLYNIAKYPGVQEKLYSEAKQFFEKNKEKDMDSKEKDMDYDKLFSLPYLSAVISESQRLLPASIFLERVPNEDYVLGDTGITLPKGSVVHIPVYSIQRNPENFTDPDQFKPERFLHENIAHNPYAFLPFGAGPRNCVGMRLALMEVKLAIITTIYNYNLSPPTKTLEFYSSNLIVPKEVRVRVGKR